jgi:triosephosphate isomerase (TIM)
MKYLFGNWKSHNTVSQTNIFFTDLVKLVPRYPQNLKTVIFIPFTDISQANCLILEKNLPVQTGAQDVSVHEEGKHTGEITASMLSELVTYCLVGHSERRQQFEESSVTVAKKASLLLERSIRPVVCVDTPYLEEQIKAIYDLRLPMKDLIFAYEPISAVGTGEPQAPETVERIVSKITFITESQCPILYGGSVDPTNIQSYLSKPHLDGVLVGNQSVTAESFAQLINSFA